MSSNIIIAVLKEADTFTFTQLFNMYLFEKITLVSPAINNRLISIVEYYGEGEYSILTYTTEKGVWKEEFKKSASKAIDTAEKSHKKYLKEYL